MATLLEFTKLDSTNSYLKTNFAALADKTVVVADEQTAGRGRFDRAWVSQKGGLYFSVLVKPVQTKFVANFTQLMALSVCQAAEELGLTPNIKWPNDVQIDGKKLCGILSEAVAQNGRISCVVVGCGVNIAQENLSVGQPAVSLADLGIKVDKKTFLKSVLKHFWQGYPAVVEGGFLPLRVRYLQRFPFIGKTVTVKNAQTAKTGVVAGLSERGTLLLDTGNGPEEILIGDVTV